MKKKKMTFNDVQKLFYKSLALKYAEQSGIQFFTVWVRGFFLPKGLGNSSLPAIPTPNKNYTSNILRNPNVDLESLFYYGGSALGLA